MRPAYCLALLVAAIPAAESSATAPSWLVVTTSTSETADDLQTAIAPLGASIVAAYPEMGTFVVSADASFPTAAAAIPGVSSIVPNVSLPAIREGVTARDDIGPASLPASEPYTSSR